MVKGSEEGAGSGEETALHLNCQIPPYGMPWMLEACFSSVQHRRNPQRKFHRGLLNTKPLAEEILESKIAGDLRIFVGEPAYFHGFMCVWCWVLLGGWAGWVQLSPQSPHVGLSRLGRISVTLKRSEKGTFKEQL